MIGYIYNPNNRVISSRVDNVTKCNDIAIKGEGLARLGDGQYLITDLEFEEGDIIPEGITDRRNELDILNE